MRLGLELTSNFAIMVVTRSNNNAPNHCAMLSTMCMSSFLYSSHGVLPRTLNGFRTSNITWAGTLWPPVLISIQPVYNKSMSPFVPPASLFKFYAHSYTQCIVYDIITQFVTLFKKETTAKNFKTEML